MLQETRVVHISREWPAFPSGQEATANPMIRCATLVNALVHVSLLFKGMKELLKMLNEVTLKQPYIGEMIPEAWLKFEKSIMR